MASAQLNTYRQTVLIKWPKDQEIGARRFLVRTARDGHAKIMADQTARSGGAPPEFIAYANTPGNTNLNTVILPGPIVYRYSYLREVIVNALGMLRLNSPIVTGAYRNAHTLFIDGVPQKGVPPVIRPGADIMIANLVPYARRLEVGLTTDGRAFVVQVPPRIYERVVKNILVPRFRSVARITMSYVEIPPAWIIKGKLPATYVGKGGVRRRRRQEIGAPVLSPCIVIESRTGG